MVSSRVLMNRMLRGDSMERVGLLDGPWVDTIVAWVKQGYPTRMVHKEVGDTYWGEDGRPVDVVEPGEYVEPVPAWEHFGYDMMGVGSWFDIQPLRGVDELVEESDEWDVRRNGAGAALKYWKHKMGTPEHIDFRMVNRDIWARDYRPHLLDLDPERIDIETAKQRYKEGRDGEVWIHFGHMFIWELMRQSMGDVVMYESLVLDPGWIHDYNQVYTQFFKTHFGYYIDQVGMPDGIWLYEDLGYKNGLFASPRVLKNLIFPYYAELVAWFHEKGLPVILHTCGSVAEAVPMIIDAGFDALNPMERKALNNDPFLFAQQYGDKLAFVGGLDARVFESNDRDHIQREVASYIDGMKARGARLVFASDHSISPRTEYDSYRYALDVYREHMWY